MAAAKQQRFFAQDEKLRVVKKSRVYDKERRQEGIGSKSKRRKARVIDVDVTGAEGVVCGEPYHNPKRGEIMVPIRLRNNAVIAVPEHRLERAEAQPPTQAQRAEEQAVAGPAGGPGAVSPDTIKFWEEHFANKAKAQELDKLKNVKG